MNNNNKNNGFSVRCLKNSEKANPAQESLPSCIGEPNQSARKCHSEKFTWLCTELFKAYREARKHKRNTANQLQFEIDLEASLFQLAVELHDRTYELSPSICFINEKPVKREVIAANFRDRVVHHLLYSWIYPIFDNQFVYDSYSCRIGKGTDFGINRARSFIASESSNFTRECWTLRLDISGFFMSINRDILYGSIKTGLDKVKWKSVPDSSLADFLIRKFVYNDPLASAKFKSSRSLWDDLPPNKSLMNSPKNCGLPIGNLTSQLFGNVYLNPLDHFIKRTLKIRCYGRYVDDMLLVHHEKSVLLDAIPKIRDFLQVQLRLNLNEKKTRLQPVHNGFPFLGAYILPWRTYPNRRTVKNFRECILHPVADECKQNSRVQSYLGYMSHYNARNLTQKFLGEVT